MELPIHSLLVQLLLWFNIGALYRTLGVGIPFGPEFVTVETVNLLGTRSPPSSV